MTKTIRILVANRPKLMRDLVVSILTEQPDMELVGEVSEEEEEDISRRIRETTPDLIVIALQDPFRPPALCETVLHQYPDVAVIAVAEHVDHLEGKDVGIIDMQVEPFPVSYTHLTLPTNREV